MLPLFTCPSMIPGVQFSNQIIGGGDIANYTSIDNATATIHAPESTTVCLAIAGWRVLLVVWACKPRRNRG